MKPSSRIPGYSPPTPLVGYYPTPHDIPLPKCPHELMNCLKFVESYINKIWRDYLEYLEINPVPRAAKIFDILFKEMDYFEQLSTIIISKIPSEMLIKHGIAYASSNR